MSNDTPVRIGLLGARGIGRMHLLGSQRLEKAHIVAVADASEALRNQVREEFGVNALYADYRELIEKETLDGVLVALPTFLHAQATLECLDQGLHVLCEKPPTCNLGEMGAVARKVRETGLTYMFARQDRFTSSVLEARRRVLDGELGTLCGAQAQWVRVRGNQLKGGSWRSIREQGGGVLLDLGIHGIDTIWFTMGCPDVVEVSAAEFVAFKDLSEDPENYNADDGAVGWIRFANGVVLQYKFAFGMNLAGPWLVGKDNEIKRANEWRSCRLYGSSAGIDIYANEMISGSRENATISPLRETGSETHPFSDQIAAFARSIRTGEEPVNSLGDAVKLTRILSALRLSADLGQALPMHLSGAPDPVVLENEALGYSDTPVLTDSGYTVHDGRRPQPPVVTPAGPAEAPSDATVLFDGSDLSAWQKSDGAPAPWKVENGYFEVVPKSGNIETKEHFGSMQLHLEFASPEEIVGTSQGRGNSGVFLMGSYEIQVLDTYRNPTYPDGTVGGIYGQYPPLANAIRPPGEWNTYDILWEAPEFAGEQLVRPARVTVILNGIVLHHAKVLQGPTQHKRLTAYRPHPPTGPLRLQDHNNPVRFRNIWVRPIGTYDT